MDSEGGSKKVKNGVNALHSLCWYTALCLSVSLSYVLL